MRVCLARVRLWGALEEGAAVDATPRHPSACEPSNPELFRYALNEMGKNVAIGDGDKEETRRAMAKATAGQGDGGLPISSRYTWLPDGPMADRWPDNGPLIRETAALGQIWRVIRRPWAR